VVFATSLVAAPVKKDDTIEETKPEEVLLHPVCPDQFAAPPEEKEPIAVLQEEVEEVEEAIEDELPPKLETELATLDENLSVA